MSITADRLVGDPILTKSHIADEAIEVGRFVKLVTPVVAGAGQPPHVVHAGSADQAAGVSVAAIASGESGSIMKLGQAWVKTSANLNAGDPVASDTNGTARVATTSDKQLGIAQMDTNSGDFCLVLLSNGGVF